MYRITFKVLENILLPPKLYNWVMFNYLNLKNILRELKNKINELIHKTVLFITTIKHI